MIGEAQPDTPPTAPVTLRSSLALRFEVCSEIWAMPLHRLHHLAGFATLTGEPEYYFLGWLSMRGESVPVFDLSRVVCDRPTPHCFGSRILVIAAGPESPTPYLGLFAAGVTETVSTATEQVQAFDLDSYLPMLYTLMPPLPTDAADA